MMTILDKIVENTKNELELEKRRVPFAEVKKRAQNQDFKRPSFLRAIRGDGLNIITEVKKASPSKGLICRDFDPVSIAMEYEQGGAAAVSVLTDVKYFQGSLNYLDDISVQVSLPLLRKDFIIDEYQIYQAKLHRSSAVLLLASVLDVALLTDLLDIAHSLDLDVLLEVHDLNELEIALQTPAKIIGVNNRDLKTFNVDLNTSAQLVKQMPEKVVKVSESGIYTHQDIRRLKKLGFDAFLIGESLMRQKNRVDALKKLRGFQCL